VAGSPAAYVLGSFALLVYLDGEVGIARVRSVLKGAEARRLHPQSCLEEKRQRPCRQERRIDGLLGSYLRSDGGVAATAIFGRQAAGDPSSDETQGLGLWARGCRTSIAHPTFSRSPSQPAHAVRAVTRSPCES